MYTPYRQICIPKPLCGEYFCSGQHPIKFYPGRFVPKNAVPLGFCSGGFSSTAGYVPGNEARSNPKGLFQAAWHSVG
jgi:hypothetical protein